MKRATNYCPLFDPPTPTAFPCELCGGPEFAWLELPHPGHNLGTLYECGACGMVVTLADLSTGDLVNLLPAGEP